MDTEVPDHALRNRAMWDRRAPDWVGPGERSWTQDEPTWGIWDLPEAKLRLIENVGGLDAIELGCGTAYVSAWLARPGGRLVFLIKGYLQMLCEPDEENTPATDRLLRDQFGRYRFEWSSDESVEFHLAHGEMIRLLHASGFEVEDLIEIQAPPGATTRHAYVPAGWARRWPSEEIWKARKRS